MKSWALSIALVAGLGCGSERNLKGDEPEMLVAGTGASSGESGQGSQAGQGGGGGQGGAAGESSAELCDPQKEADAGWVAPDVETMDAGGMLAERDEDAGVEAPEPPPTNQDPPADAGSVEVEPARTPQTAGDLIFTELLPDPTALSDTLGEWIEIHNGTEHALDLADCVLSDDSRDHYVFAELHVPANGYVVLGRSAMAAVHVDLVYDGVTLTNTEDELVLTCNDVMIDRVAYGAGFPRTAGRSMQLDPNVLNASDNDSGQSWCSGAESGTPGQANAVCPTR